MPRPLSVPVTAPPWIASWYRPSTTDRTCPCRSVWTELPAWNVSVTTVWPEPLVVTAAFRPTVPTVPVSLVIVNAAAALASPPAKLTGPENVTTIDPSMDRWADPSLTCTPAMYTGLPSLTATVAVSDAVLNAEVPPPAPG